jgi:predicted methyltransferase MtxX (methanogen marker protein 4)
VLLDDFIKRAELSHRTIAIGIGDNPEGNDRIIKAVSNIQKKSSNKFVLIGYPKDIDLLRKSIKTQKNQLKLIGSANPYEDILKSILLNDDLQDDLKQKVRIDGIIRGGLSASNFLKNLRSFPNDHPNVKDLTSDTYRLALLETSTKHQFFFAPVGIDEANSYSSKLQFLEQAIKFLQSQGIVPKIGILSGGRSSDIGRDSQVDATIKEAEQLIEYFTKKMPSLFIKHYQILIEDAIAEKVNVLLAPEGIAGNLIYRTLIHLGEGKSYGAIYLSQYNLIHKIIIDTSRVAPIFEIEGAIYFALGV